MGDGSEPEGLAAGGPALHRPVLLAEVLAAMKPRDGLRILDGTFGGGGYTKAMLAAGARVIGLDRDPTARVAASDVAVTYPDTFRFRQTRFATLDTVAVDLGWAPLDGVVLDVGVSSMQLDQPERGFSFRSDGPLDMRMERDGPSAADIINTNDEAELAAILFHFGEERESRRIARAIVADRGATPFTSTRQLAALVSRVIRRTPSGIHPATRTFQALRIAVNDELGELVAALEAAERGLSPGGILAVVTFHSLEDRLVKRFLARTAGRGGGGSRHLPRVEATPPSFSLPPGQPVLPGMTEVAANPRARSAKLRIGIRTDAAPMASDPDLHASLHRGAGPVER